MIGVIALGSYDMREFTGLSYLDETDPDPGELITTGLNRYVRHPLYFAGILLMMGYLLIFFTDVNLLLVAIIFIYLIIGAQYEEKKLEATFGEDYRKYQEKVKMLIPFVF